MKCGKRLSRIKHGVVACAVLLSVSAVKAQSIGQDAVRADDKNVKSTPVMVSFFSPIEIPFDENSAWDVRGLRLSLPYGKCRDMIGLDLGLVTHSSSMFGLQVAGVNIVEDDVRMTMSAGLLANYVGGSYVGFQFAGLANIVEDDAYSLSVAGVNYTGGSYTGLQIGLVNVVPTQAKHAWQIGFWNHGGAFDHCGQIGIFNYVRDMTQGVQFGLVNIIENNQYPCIPFINCNF